MKKRRLVALVCTMALLSTMFGCASGKKEDGKKETISESRDESSSEIETTVNNDGTTSRDENSSQSTSDKETESTKSQL